MVDSLWQFCGHVIGLGNKFYFTPKL